MSDEEFEELTSEEIVDWLESTLDPTERAEFDRHCWALVWERAALAGEIDVANLISRQEEGRRDS
jgi:hypothetical protein